jgi:predicted metalloprotease with PDZ domain
MLREYAASPVVNAPGALILTDFWKTNQVHQLPYWRGAILAATWDRELRRRSGGRVGLDQVMRAMRAQVAKRGARGPKAPDLFVAVARRYGLDVRDDLARVMDRGETAQLPPDAFGPCLPIHEVRLPSYDSGFEVSDADNKRTITGVKPGSPAYAAGLRDGMLFVRREAGVRGDSRVAYRLRVLDGGAERVISFQPVGQGMETLQEIVLPNNLTPQQRQACVAQAAGTDGAR